MVESKVLDCRSGHRWLSSNCSFPCHCRLHGAPLVFDGGWMIGGIIPWRKFVNNHGDRFCPLRIVLWGRDPSKWPWKWLINGSDPNLQTGMILRVDGAHFHGHQRDERLWIGSDIISPQTCSTKKLFVLLEICSNICLVAWCPKKYQMNILTMFLQSVIKWRYNRPVEVRVFLYRQWNPFVYFRPFVGVTSSGWGLPCWICSLRCFFLKNGWGTTL